MKTKIIEILIKNQEIVYGKGSCGELGDAGFAVNSVDFEFIANEIEKEITSNFEEAARPLMKYLGYNHHPHTSAYVRNDLAELLEGQQVFGTDDYILD